MRALRIAGLTAAVGFAAVGTFLYAQFGAFLPWREAAEADRLADLIGVRHGQTIAEIGAGDGRFTVAVGRRVGAVGKIYSTELTQENRDAVRARVKAAGLSNVLVVDARPLETNLPDACCDIVFMRNVYHHIPDSDAFTRSVRRAVRSGGRLAVIDFDPGALWMLRGPPDDASDRRPGHGVARADAIAEFAAAGFKVERDIAHWSGPMWLLLFRAV